MSNGPNLEKSCCPDTSTTAYNLRSLTESGVPISDAIRIALSDATTDPRGVPTDLPEPFKSAVCKLLSASENPRIDTTFVSTTYLSRYSLTFNGNQMMLVKDLEDSTPTGVTGTQTGRPATSD